MSVLATVLLLVWGAIVVTYAAYGYQRAGGSESLVCALESGCLYGFILYFVYIGILRNNTVFGLM